MKSPSWWHEKSVISFMMRPLSYVYHAVHRMRHNLIASERVSVPVICIGNVTAGGAGKTPTVMALAYRLTAMGERPHVISRGYGGTITEKTQVDAAIHSVAEVGDEPLLIAKAAPCWVGRNRVDSARAAIAHGATILLMDDGFQNPSLHKDMSIIVVDGGYGFGNEAILPAGPLREPLDEALRRADAVLLIGDDSHNIANRLDEPLLLRATLDARAPIEKKNYLAFAGIGRPQKFYDTLIALGATLVATQDFPDHHIYKDADISRLSEKAKARNAQLITTEKDAVKLSDEQRTYIDVMPVSLRFDAGEEALEKLLSSVISNGEVACH